MTHVRVCEVIRMTEMMEVVMTRKEALTARQTRQVIVYKTAHSYPNYSSSKIYPSGTQGLFSCPTQKAGELNRGLSHFLLFFFFFAKNIDALFLKKSNSYFKSWLGLFGSEGHDLSNTS